MGVWDRVGDLLRALPSTRQRGLWPSRVMTHRQPDPASLAIQKSLPRAQGSQLGQIPSPRCPSSFLLQWGKRCRVRNTKAITFSSFQSSPRPKPTTGILRARGHTVSSLETGYSIRVTPTCKTETIALTKRGLPHPKWGQFHTSSPCWGKGGTGSWGQAGWAPPSLNKAA